MNRTWNQIYVCYCHIFGTSGNRVESQVLMASVKRLVSILPLKSYHLKTEKVNGIRGLEPYVKFKDWLACMDRSHIREYSLFW